VVCDNSPLIVNLLEVFTAKTTDTMLINDTIEDALHTVLYILNQMGGVCDKHKICKVLYFADQKFLVKWGDTITDGDYNAYKYGPVPNLTLGLIKALDRTGTLVSFKNEIEQFFIKEGKNDLRSVRATDFDEISEAAVKTINEVILEHGGKNFDQLTNDTHGKAWQNARKTNNKIKLMDIAEEAGASEAVIDYMKVVRENEAAFDALIKSVKLEKVSLESKSTVKA